MGDGASAASERVAAAGASGRATRKTEGAGSDDESADGEVEVIGVLTARRWAEPVSGDTGVQAVERGRSAAAAGDVGGGWNTPASAGAADDDASGQRRLPIGASVDAVGREARATSSGGPDPPEATDERETSGVKRPPTMPVGPSA